ncbi:MAG: ribosomal RNA small subunit methyltransferase A [Desulfobulbaceae bacterium]|nr:ribosomal RNA small subunit methyltransferase A [Candidatus Kapabacteria bacterium]MBS3999594.1 ribosomal RNA small subunit methyltransferase A [Desulfobulbaceae bacterium]
MEKVKPKKSFGQNFLTDKNISSKIVSLLNVVSDDIVIEIGPGMGALTEILLGNQIKLVAVELDEHAISYLNEKFKADKFSNLKIIHQSILDLDFMKIYKQYGNKKIKVIGNIPYNISTEILFKLLENRDIIENIVLTVQKEVGQRITSQEGSRIYGITSIAAWMVSTPMYHFDIAPGSFYPAPKVTSGVISLEMNKQIEQQYYDDFMKFIKTLFNQRRKMISNSIKNYLPKERLAQLAPSIEATLSKRPEQLSLTELVNLFDKIREQRND